MPTLFISRCRDCGGPYAASSLHNAICHDCFRCGGGDHELEREMKIAKIPLTTEDKENLGKYFHDTQDKERADYIRQDFGEPPGEPSIH